MARFRDGQSNNRDGTEWKLYYDIGLKYLVGDGVTQDYSKAIKWLRIAADHGHIDAITKLEELEQRYHKSDLKPRVFSRSDPTPPDQSEITDPETQFEIGKKHYNGEGVARDSAEAAKWYRLSAEQGHSGAQCNLGLMYRWGYGVKQDYSEALKWCRLAAYEGNSEAQCNLGHMYRWGYGVKQDYSEALKWYRLAADQGHVEAKTKIKELEWDLTPKDTVLQKSNKSDTEQNVSNHCDPTPPERSEITNPETQFEIGVKYYRGTDVTRDYSEAVKWYRLAANQGYANAQCNLGNMYSWGCGVTQDYAEALKWYRLAADKGHVDAKTKIRELERKLTPKDTGQQKSDKSDPKQQVSECSDPTPQGEITDTETLFEIGNKYFNGEGVAQDYVEAVKWYRLAAEQGYAPAQFNLGEMYEWGRGMFVDEDCYEAIKWYRLAADQGHKEAVEKIEELEEELARPNQYYAIGLRHYNGEGVAQDYSEAAKWFRIAADQGDADAQNKLGGMYSNGQGVTQDYNEAVKWYRLAANQGCADAQLVLGFMYKRGYGVTQNYDEAVKWYRLGADQGNAEAQNNLGFMYDNGLGVLPNRYEAVQWYRLAADQGLSLAQFNLGVSYQNGQGVNQDYNEAVKWYRLAADRGHARAKTKLQELKRKLKPKDNLQQKSNKSVPKKKVSKRNDPKPINLDAKGADVEFHIKLTDFF